MIRTTARALRRLMREMAMNDNDTDAIVAMKRFADATGLIADDKSIHDKENIFNVGDLYRDHIAISPVELASAYFLWNADEIIPTIAGIAGWPLDNLLDLKDQLRAKSGDIIDMMLSLMTAYGGVGDEDEVRFTSQQLIALSEDPALPKIMS